MKTISRYIFVVEGRHDQALITSLFETEVVVINGLEAKQSELKYLRIAGNYKKIIVLTDPDEIGRKLSEKILKELPLATDLLLELDKCNKKGKHGVAECDREYIKQVLIKFTDHIYVKNKPLFDINDIININDTCIKQKVCLHFHLGDCNTKTMIKRLTTLGISQEDLEKVIYGN